MEDNHENDLQNLWQSENTEVDIDMIMQTRDTLVRGRSLGRRIYNAMLAFNVLVILMTAGFEVSGIYKTRGAVTAFLTLTTIIAFWRTARARKRTPVLGTLGPEGLLVNALQRARNNLKIARVLYFGLPVSSVLSGGLALAFSDKLYDNNKLAAMPSSVSLIVMVLLVSALVIAALYGVWLAKQTRPQIAQLEARMKDFKESL